MRLGLIVQRYGEGVDGGAEVHCRAVAERLAARHQVTVLTTCAQDYLSWANHFPPGSGELNGVKVLRFPVARPRRMRLFNFLAKRLYTQKHSIDAEWRWLVRQGPYAPGLIDHLLTESRAYDALIFWTYLYFPTAAGLPLVSCKSILVPTAHDEIPLYLALFRPVFHLPRYILFNTEAERESGAPGLCQPAGAASGGGSWASMTRPRATPGASGRATGCKSLFCFIWAAST